MRFCCDFRTLNEVTIKDAYPLTRINESLARLGKAKIYTSIDLAWPFWQIPVRKADRHKTVFACELGLFEWRRMSLCICNASATFQRAIARTAKDSQPRLLCRTQRANKRDKQAKALAAPLPPLHPPEPQVHEDFHSNYPEDWIDVTEGASD